MEQASPVGGADRARVSTFPADPNPGYDMLRNAFSISLVLALATVAQGQFTDVTLGQRYRNQVHGFSLRPPAGAQKVTGGSSTRLVSWQVRDPKTDAVAWRLSVQQLIEEDAKGNLATYGRKLKATFDADKRFKLESFQPGQIAGKPAIHINGQSQVGQVVFWQQQLRVLPEDGRLLIFTVSGPPSQSKNLGRIARSIFATLEITDPEKFREQHARSVQRAQALLAGLDEGDVRSALIRQRQWFLLTYKGRKVGWMMQTEKLQQRENARGALVESWAEMHLADAPVRRMKRELFGTADREYSRWMDFLQVGAGEKAQVRIEDGVKRQDAIVVDLAVGAKLHTISRRTPEETTEIYLPKVHEALIYRLIDTGRGGGYIFATYDASENGFNMHMLNLQSVKRLNIGGRSVVATGLTQQKDYDAPVSKVWIDSKGLLLRLESEDGFVIERSSESAVLKNWPRAMVSIKQINDRVKAESDLLKKLPNSRNRR